ncbi:MAG: subclass B1 metallo-beta-lactamase [Bacteroidota bacterium]
MRYNFFSILLIINVLISCSVNAQKGLSISRLSERAFVYTSRKTFEDGTQIPANGIYYISPLGAILVDPPWGDEPTKALIDSIQRRHGQKTIASISTHSHNDRTSGIEVLKNAGAKTYASCQTRDLCIEKHEQVPAFCFSKDTVFNFGGLKLETFYPGPGHAPDNIVVWSESEKVLSGGCFLKSAEAKDLGNIADANLKAWPASLRKMQARYMYAGIIIPGHQGWEKQKMVAHTLNLLRKAGYK